MTNIDLTQEIKSLAIEIGFAAVGITLPEPPLHLDVYLDWIKQQRHGEMAYLAAPRSVFLRSSPGELLPNCQSIIVLAARYTAPPSLVPSDERLRAFPSSPSPLGREARGEEGKHPGVSVEGNKTTAVWEVADERSESRDEASDGMIAGTETRESRTALREENENTQAQIDRDERFFEGTEGQGDEPLGRVAAYAWGQDYHFVLRERMERLVQRIQHRVGHPISYRCFTDSAPVLERELAQRAGLGWIGKNTCLIHPRFGSYLFLAEIFTDLPLTPDQPFLADRCGRCELCIQACPTGCILPNRTLDARKCISYLTIEHRSAIPPALRPELGDWVFGCDICQQVCPWNRRPLPTPSFPEFLPQAERVGLSLAKMLEMTKGEFKRRFQHSPLSRARWRGLSRNSAIVLGNLVHLRKLPEKSVIEFIDQILQNHPDPLVRQHLAWALAQADGPQARQAMERHSARESDSSVKAEIEALLR